MEVDPYADFYYSSRKKERERERERQPREIRPIFITFAKLYICDRSFKWHPVTKGYTTLVIMEERYSCSFILFGVDKNDQRLLLNIRIDLKTWFNRMSAHFGNVKSHVNQQNVGLRFPPNGSIEEFIAKMDELQKYMLTAPCLRKRLEMISVEDGVKHYAKVSPVILPAIADEKFKLTIKPPTPEEFDWDLFYRNQWILSLNESSSSSTKSMSSEELPGAIPKKCKKKIKKKKIVRKPPVLQKTTGMLPPIGPVTFKSTTEPVPGCSKNVSTQPKKPMGVKLPALKVSKKQPEQLQQPGLAYPRFPNIISTVPYSDYYTTGKGISAHPGVKVMWENNKAELIAKNAKDAMEARFPDKPKLPYLKEIPRVPYIKEKPKLPLIVENPTQGLLVKGKKIVHWDHNLF